MTQKIITVKRSRVEKDYNIYLLYVENHKLTKIPYNSNHFLKIEQFLFFFFLTEKDGFINNLNPSEYKTSTPQGQNTYQRLDLGSDMTP